MLTCSESSPVFCRAVIEGFMEVTRAITVICSSSTPIKHPVGLCSYELLFNYIYSINYSASYSTKLCTRLEDSTVSSKLCVMQPRRMKL